MRSVRVTNIVTIVTIATLVIIVTNMNYNKSYS